MHTDIQTLKENLRIPEVWHRLALPGEPRSSCRSPFRPDKTPSFSIFNNDQRWKDFSTGEGGDVIDFIAHALDINAKEATKRFIEIAGGNSIHSTLSRHRSLGTGKCKTDDGDTEEKARKRTQWPEFSPPEPETRRAVAESRNISPDAPEIGELIGTIRYAELFGFRCWVLTDDFGWNAEARRVDGLDFTEVGDLPARKAHTLRGSLKSWPAGTAAFRRLPSFSRVMLVEGSPDYLAALHFASAHIDTHGGVADTLPIAMLGRGTGSAIHPDALTILAGRRVRIYPHHDADGGGMERANKWASQLHAVECVVDFFLFDHLTRRDGQPVNDLNDLCHLTPSQLSEITDLLP